MIMSSYFNVQYLHQKMIRIYADIVQNHTLPGVFPNFWRAVYVYVYVYVYMYMYVYVYICIYIYTHTYIHIHIPFSTFANNL